MVVCNQHVRQQDTHQQQVKPYHTALLPGQPHFCLLQLALCTAPQHSAGAGRQAVTVPGAASPLHEGSTLNTY